MTTSIASCINCDRTDTEVPLSSWRYQGRDLTICSDCLPMLIHHRDELLARQDNAPNKSISEPGDQDAK